MSGYVSNTNPVRLPNMQQATTQAVKDTRGLDLTLDLNNPAEPLNDPLAYVDSITVSRLDGQATTANDLTITPSGTSDPWLTTTKLGSQTSTGFFVHWWQGVDYAIAADGPVDYEIVVEGRTSGGRSLAWTAHQLVVARMG